MRICNLCNKETIQTNFATLYPKKNYYDLYCDDCYIEIMAVGGIGSSKVVVVDGIDR